MTCETLGEQLFDPFLCAGETIENFEHEVYVGAGGDWPNQPPLHAEERFLDPNQFGYPEQLEAEGILSLPDVETQTQRIVRETPPTTEALIELHQQARTTLLSWGTGVLADALAVQTNETPLVTPLTRSEAIDRLGWIPNIGEGRHLEKALTEEGHVILPASQSQPSVLVVRSSETAGLLAVDLDALDDTLPGMVGQKITEWHLAKAQADLSLRASRNITYHEYTLQEVTPPFLLSLAEMTPEQRQLEVTQCLAILDRIATLGSSRRDISGTFGNLLYSLRDINGPLSRGINPPEGVYSSDVLGHITRCSGRDIDQSPIARVIQAARKKLIERASQPVLTELGDGADTPILEDPAFYLFSLDHHRAMEPAWRRRRESLLAEATTMRSQAEHASLGDVMETMRQEDSDRFAALQSLRELLGTRPDILTETEVSQLDTLVDKVAQRCAGTGYLRESSPNNLQELRKIISSELEHAFYWRRNHAPDHVMPSFEGISIDELSVGRQPFLYAGNPHLKHTLTFLALVRARELASDKRSNNINQLMEETIAATEEDAQRYDPVIDSLQERGIVADSFFARHGLSEADFRPLAVMAYEEFGHMSVPYHVYTLLANMIVMTRHGQANIFSTVQRGLVQTLFQSEVYKESAAHLSRAWLALDEYLQSRS